MEKIPKKNYLILAVLLLTTVLITLVISNIYLNKDKLVSDFYEYSNNITPEEFDEYMIENSDLIIYISDKYDLSHETFEMKFENKLDDLNLKNKLIFIDKNDINQEFLANLEDIYNINVDLKKTPIIVVIVDKKVIKSVSIKNDSDVDSIISYEVFE